MWHLVGTGEIQTRLGWGILMEEDHLEDLGIDGRIILVGLQGVGWGDMNWMDLAQGRGRWRALLNAVTT